MIQATASEGRVKIDVIHEEELQSTTIWITQEDAAELLTKLGELLNP